jgi:hypothetical protein
MELSYYFEMNFKTGDITADALRTVLRQKAFGSLGNETA